jgi:hypothetical protein
VIGNQLRNENVSILITDFSNFDNDKASDAKINEIGDDVDVHLFGVL